MLASPDTSWSIGKFYSQAWEITKEHKKLWIFGLAATIFASGGSNFNGGGSSSTPSTPSQDGMVDEAEAQTLDQADDSQMVEDESTQFSLTEEEWATSEDTSEFSVALSTFTGHISPWTWFVLITVGIGFIIASIILALVAANWAVGSLTIAFDQIVKNPKKELDLHTVSIKALDRVKSMIWLKIVPTLGFMAAVIIAVIAAFIVGAILTAVSSSTGGVIAVVGSIIGIIAFFFFYLKFWVAITWAERVCLLEEKSGSESFSTGWQLTNGTKRKALRLGFANTIVQGMAIGGPAIILVVSFISMPVFRPVLNGDMNGITPGLIVTGVIFVIALMVLMYLITTVMNVFKSGAWYFAYQSIRHHK